MASLPNTAAATAAAGSLWSQTYTLTDSTGTPINLAGLTFAFVVRPNATNNTEPALISVASTSSTSQGSITITPTSGIVTVTLTPAATALLGTGTSSYALWSSPGTSAATCWVQGNLASQIVPIP